MADKTYWIDANGTEYSFDTSNMKVLLGMRGKFMPPIEYVEDEIPLQPGAVLRAFKVKPRDIDIPLFIKASSEIELRNLVRSTLRMVNPLKRDGQIKVVSSDGSQRVLNCRYTGGFEGDEGQENSGILWQKTLLTFRAFDPFWYDSSTVVQTFTTGQPATFFPFFPLRLSSSTVFADIAINNRGDVETYPEWIVKGPGDGIVIRNLTTGEVINLNTTLSIGETLIINTKPLKKSIKKTDGTNLFSSQSDDSSFWALQPGQNSIRIEMSNATTDSSVQLSYTPRYWSP
ncbi:phage distal tail protein [Gottfriedia acidiceleris]|uniref:phage distal tail protein n=1 Tax=Gottfriedia acidiceleris TaxID=371036 RepID=UPI00101C6964|nr:phage tail domain-containing protein [Gottfriedia acidiceleris]